LGLICAWDAPLPHAALISRAKPTIRDLMAGS
jgi:hypothetical protein